MKNSIKELLSNLFNEFDVLYKFSECLYSSENCVCYRCDTLFHKHIFKVYLQDEYYIFEFEQSYFRNSKLVTKYYYSNSCIYSLMRDMKMFLIFNGFMLRDKV